MASRFLDAVAAAAESALPALPGSGLAWLEAARRRQLDALLRDGLPGARSEAWKYTPLRALDQRRYATGDAAAADRPVDASLFQLPEVDGPRLVFVNGVFRADLSALGSLPDGLELQPLAHALQGAAAEPLRFFLGRDWADRSDAFVRLNAAFASDGMVLRVAAGSVAERPVHLVHVGAPADTALAWHSRNVIELGQGASLRLVEHHLASGAHTHLGTLVSDVVLRAGARLDALVLQDAAEGAVLVRRHALRLDADASARVHALELGGALVRHELDVELRGDGARLETRGAFLPRGRQHMDTRLDIRHAARNTRSDALWRGVADQRGRGVFHGQIVVAPGADGTDAALSNKNLLLSPHAEIDSQPVLEIYADEVKAAHGATVGQLDERSLFYLRSRGLPFEQARNLLTVAFCRAALDSVPEPALREHLNRLLAAHLPLQIAAGTEQSGAPA
ncbi:MAG TPA: Fe-S cluster assembly protein SufD [Rhodanobacteraceae bacterium]|nr:Fe-S cluster assembly protein SufD [Rhodanobacteraceae bacterium]